MFRPNSIVQSVITLFLILATVGAHGHGAGVSRRANRNVQAGAAITAFLSSVEFSGQPAVFDHDHDGTADMYVYPLVTTRPDFKTRYTTLEEATRSKKVILQEGILNPAPSGKQPPSSYNIVAMGIGMSRPASRPGYSYSSGTSLGLPSAFTGGGSSMYYPRGGMMTGGYQGRGFQGGGMFSPYGGGGYPRSPGYGPYGGNPRSPGYGPYGKLDLTSDDFSTAVALGEFGSPVGGAAPGRNLRASGQAEKREVELKALCFEKWRLIEESRRKGESEHFSYVGMASPYVRKELVLFPNQINVDKVIARELRELGVHSRTSALADVFKNERMKRVIDYYKANCEKILGKKKNISGMIVTSAGRILCADVYASPDLFRKMLPQLMQSAALGVCRAEQASRKHLTQGDVERFLHQLRQTRKFKRENSQTYRLFYPKIIGAVELYPDRDMTKVIHLEAYRR